MIMRHFRLTSDDRVKIGLIRPLWKIDTRSYKLMTPLPFSLKMPLPYTVRSTTALPNKITGAHHLLFSLIKGYDVFAHFHPKHEENALMAALRRDETVQHPYIALINACRAYMGAVPKAIAPAQFSGSWERAAHHLRSMDALRYPITPVVSIEVLIALRPHVKIIFDALIKEHRDIFRPY